MLLVDSLDDDSVVRWHVQAMVALWSLGSSGNHHSFDWVMSMMPTLLTAPLAGEFPFGVVLGRIIALSTFRMTCVHRGQI